MSRKEKVVSDNNVSVSEKKQELSISMGQVRIKRRKGNGECIEGCSICTRASSSRERYAMSTGRHIILEQAKVFLSSNGYWKQGDRYFGSKWNCS